MSKSETDSVTRSGSDVAVLCIDIPHSRNALDIDTLGTLLTQLQAMRRDPCVRVVLLKATGTVFSSGADLKELEDPEKVLLLGDLVARVVREIADMEKPVLCAVNGDAYGAGLAMLSAADISIAVRRARFAVPEVRYGMIATVAAACLVPRIGEAASLDLFLTGRRFGAEEACRLGVLTSIVDDSELEASVDEKVAELLRGSMMAVGLTKQLVRGLRGPLLVEALRTAAEFGDRMTRSMVVVECQREG